MTDDTHALVGAYVLDALSDLERVAFARHLAGCEPCTREVVELRATAARLADPVTATPPARLRASVLAEVSRTRQLGPPALPAPSTSPARTGRSPVTRPGRLRRLLAVAAAVVVVAAGAVGATVLVDNQRVRTAQQRASQADQVAAVLAASDARTTTVPASTGTGQVTVVSSESLDASVAFLGGLPAPGVTSAYELWTIRGPAAPVPAGVLAAGASGGLRLMPHTRGVGTYAVSQEAAGGSTTGRPRMPLVAYLPVT